MRYQIVISFLDGSSKTISLTESFEPAIVYFDKNNKKRINEYGNAEALILDNSRDLHSGKRKVIKLATIEDLERNKTVELFKYTPQQLQQTKTEVKKTEQKQLIAN